MLRRVTFLILVLVISVYTFGCTQEGSTKATGAKKAMDTMSTWGDRAEWYQFGNPKTEDIFLQEMFNSIVSGFEKYSSIPEVKEMKRLYGDSISIYSTSNGKDRYYLHNYTSGKIEVLVYPETARQKMVFPSLVGHFQPEGDRDFIAIPGFKSDPIWFNARFLHELHHKMQFDNKNPSSTAKRETDLWVEEEVNAHDLASNILNQGTNGEYYAKIQTIINRTESKTLSSFLDSISTADFKNLDSLFKPASNDELRNRLPQYYFDIAGGWLKIHYEGEALTKQRITVYQQRHGK